jgi:hypothetical protein
MLRLAVGLITHGAGLAVVVSSSDDWSLVPSLVVGSAYVCGLIVFAALQPLRIALAVVIGESVGAVALGAVIGGYENEAWGTSIFLLTAVATVLLSLTASVSASLRRLRTHRSDGLS